MKINLNDVFSSSPKIKYACSKNILALAREDPAALYPELDFFVKLLDSENNILKWTAIDIIGAVAKVDKNNSVDNLLDRLIGLLNTGNMITANHAISALTDIALAKPEYREKIAGEVLKVEQYNYPTDECRNIAIGKALLGIGEYFTGLKDTKPVFDFAKRQVNNSRNATAKKAGQFLKKYGARL